MNKNLMPEVLKLLGVEFGEKFKLRQEKDFIDATFVFNEHSGLVQILPDGSIDEVNSVIYDILNGCYEIEKLPWEPEYKEYYYWPSVKQKMVMRSAWWGATDGYCLKALGMIYRTEEEAKEHLAEDYQRLTGKELKG